MVNQHASKRVIKRGRKLIPRYREDYRTREADILTVVQSMNGSRPEMHRILQKGTLGSCLMTRQLDNLLKPLFSLSII